MLFSAGTATARPVLTVFQEAGDSKDWTAIVEQLEQSEIGHRKLKEDELSLTTLQDVEVLFLPNVSDLDGEQLQILETWIRSGTGQLIVSGPIPRLTAENLRQFRLLMGGYWANNRRTAASVVATSAPGNEWAQTVQANEPLEGGSLIPSGTRSSLAATWSGQVGSPVAVISTPQSIYLGWKWGTEGTPSEVDRQWLLAALDRFDENQLDGDNPAPSPTAAANTVASDSRETPVTDRILGLNRLNDTISPAPSGRSATRATEIADPYISSLPVNTLEMIGMRSELNSLLGRVESAILTTDANSLDGDGLPDRYRAIIEQARQVQSELDDWVSSGQHERARREHATAISNLWNNYPRDRLTALPEVRAIWLDRGTIVDARSPAGLADVFDRLEDAGINTVFFETINAGYPVYPSRIAPTQNPLTRGWDPLKAAVSLARERDMELHAWMWTFAVGNSRHNVLPEVGLPEDYIGPVLSAHPSWSNYDARGRQFPSGQPETWLDPANNQARNYLISLMREMVTDYGVDGIHLDYIRYPFQRPGSRISFGFGQAARSKFQQLTGVDPQVLDPNRDRSLWSMWTEFRAEQVTSFVAAAADEMERLNPQVVMSAAVYPMPHNERMQKLQQEWETWIARGDLDLLVPMTYVENSRRMEQLVRPALEATSNSPVLLLPSLNLLDLPEVEFLDSMQAVRDLPTGGYSLFAARHLNGEFQNILNQSRISSSQIPYRAPFGASVFRFNALQKEWQTLLAKDQMWVPERFQTEWQEQVDRVSQALKALEASPSLVALGTAQEELTALRQGIEEWFRFEALERPYRVGTWENRLLGLDTLLRYGEQRLPRLQSANR
ncbi:MAG: glycoside hydrolase family 10 protein [Synechococcus sp.]